MAQALHDEEPVAIADIDDLRRVAREVQTKNEPLVVSIVGGAEIELRPVRRKRTRRSKEERDKADNEAFLSSAGSWKGHLDPDEFLRQIKDARGSRPRGFERLMDEE